VGSAIESKLARRVRQALVSLGDVIPSGETGATSDPAMTLPAMQDETDGAVEARQTSS
jgi:hypothetical protein